MDTYRKTRGSVYITIRSRDLTNTNDNGNQGRFTLFEGIQAGEGEILGVKLTSATMPNSWYNLSASSGNNKLYFKEFSDSGYITLTIPDGNYSIDELGTELKTQLEANSTNTLTYTFTYNEKTNALTIKNAFVEFPTDFDFTQTDTCRRFLGFTSSIQTIDSAGGITSDRAVDITDTQNGIYIRLPNMSNQKVIESSSGRYSNIIAHIPVLLARNAFFTYEPSNPFEMELAQKQINSIEISITYQNEADDVDFNKGDWEINLEVNFHKKPIPIRQKIHLHKDIINKYENYETKMIEKKKRLDDLLKMRKSIPKK